MKSIIIIVFFIAMLFLNLACEKQNLETTRIDLEFASNDNSDLFSLDSGSTAINISIDSVVFVLGNMELKMYDATIEENVVNSYEYEGEFLSKGPYAIDLLAGKSTPVIPLGKVKPGVYSKLTADLVVSETLGYSVYISGAYSTEINSGQKFIYTNSQTGNFKAENFSGFAIAGDILNYVLVNVKMNNLFANVDLSQAYIDNDNIARIQNDSNTDLAEIIEKNMNITAEINTKE